MARLEIPDSDIHDSYYAVKVLVIRLGLAHIRVRETVKFDILAVTALYLREGQRFFCDQLAAFSR